jgi:hypothetical protein
MPSPVWSVLNNTFWKISDSTNPLLTSPPYLVDCGALEAEGIITIGFLGDAKISLPVRGLAYNNGSACITMVEPCTQCSTGYLANTWGPPFLSNVYSTFNPDNFTVAFSQVVITNETLIEAL